MKKIYAFTAIALLLGLSSCLSTVQPIFTEKDLVFDPQLIGKWGYTTHANGAEEIKPEELEKNPRVKQQAKTIYKGTLSTSVKDVKASFSGYVEIAKAVANDIETYPGLQNLLGKMYIIKYTDQNGVVESKYYGFLVKLGQKLYMDYFPAETPVTSQYNEFYQSHYVKLHTCYRFEFLENNVFELKQFDAQFMKKLIDNKKIRIRHEIRDDDTFVVTASTEELQQYITKYSDVPEAYYENNISLYTKIKP